MSKLRERPNDRRVVPLLSDTKCLSHDHNSNLRKVRDKGER